MFNKLIEILKANPRKIVLPDGPDPRIIEAAARLNEGGFLAPVLIGTKEEFETKSKELGFDLTGVEMLRPTLLRAASTSKACRSSTL